jgi:hypothetical protein
MIYILFVLQAMSTQGHSESLLSSSAYFDSSPTRHLSSSSSQINNTSSIFSLNQPQNLLSTTPMVDEYDPLWLEFIQSLNTVDTNCPTQPNTTQSTVIFDSLFSENDDDDDEFIGPDDENNIENDDQRKLRVSSKCGPGFKNNKLSLFFFRT